MLNSMNIMTINLYILYVSLAVLYFRPEPDVEYFINCVVEATILACVWMSSVIFYLVMGLSMQEALRRPVPCILSFMLTKCSLAILFPPVKAMKKNVGKRHY